MPECPVCGEPYDDHTKSDEVTIRSGSDPGGNYVCVRGRKDKHGEPKLRCYWHATGGEEA